MTITARNRIIKGGAAVSVTLSLLAITLFILLCTGGQRDSLENLSRFVELPDTAMLAPNFYAAVTAVLVLVLAGTIALLRVYFLFEKTPSIEITFFSAALIALPPECARLFVPFFGFWDAQPFMLTVISRSVLFVRTFFVLAILAGSVFSIEKAMQKPGTFLFFMLTAAFFTATGVPVNYSEFGSAFFQLPGYSKILFLILALLLLLASFSFFIQAKAASISEYFKTGLGCLYLTAGWCILGNCDCWAFLAAGALLFFAGTSLYIRSLHKIYLWQ